MTPTSRRDLPPRPELEPRIVPLLIPVFVALGTSLYADYVVDDAYITYRYARNLAVGHGAVFNPGEFVEGYTNFLWMLLASAGIRLGLDPLVVSRTLGLASLGLLLGIVGRRGHVLTRRRADARAVLFVAAYGGLYTWAFSGLETVFFALLVTWGSLALIDPAPRRRPVSFEPELAFTLASLTRPEGAWFLAMTVVKRWFDGPRTTRALSPPAAAVLVWSGFLLGRWAYYGSLVPNTFHAKVGSTVDQIGRGASYLVGFSESLFGHGLTVAILAAVLMGRRDPAIRWGSLLVAPYLFYVVLVGGDSFPLFRFLVPVTPLVLLFAVRGLTDLAAGLPPARHRWFATLAFPIFGLGLFLTSHGPHQESIARDRAFTREFVGFGRWLASWADDDWTLAVVAAGAIPYFSELTTIDMLGLTDTQVAHHLTPGMGRGRAGHEKSHVEYVLGRRPDVIYTVLELDEAPPLDLRALPARAVFEPEHLLPAIRDLWEHRLFRETYVQRHVELDGRTLVFYASRGSPAATRPIAVTSP